MGYLFTLLYIAASYVTPPVLFGPLAGFHIEIVFAVLAIAFSAPSLKGSGLLRAPQTLAVAGMAVAIVMSILDKGWIGGAISAFYGFLQPVFTFYLVAVNCKTRRHFEWIILALLLGSTYFIVNGILDLHNNVIPSQFLYGDGTLRRLRGLGFVHDPNDLSQVMVSLIPCVFLWRKKSLFANIFVIGIPVGVLLTGMYFTHSRGAILALLAVIIVSARRKIGTVPALIMAAALFAGSFAVNWSGGRDISMEGGADRLDLWSEGLELIKSHPLFGIGVDAFSDYTGHTAHNSVVVCAAETGIVGLYFWVLYVLSTVRLGVLLGFASTANKKEETVAAAEGPRWYPPLALPKPALEPYQGSGAVGSNVRGGVLLENKPLKGGHPGYSKPDLALAASHTLARTGWHPGEQPRMPAVWASNVPAEDTAVPQMSFEEIQDIARIFIFALTGMLVAGWFLSRAFSQWLFLLCGMIYATSRMVSREGHSITQDKTSVLLRWTALIAVGLLIGIYILLKFRIPGAG